MENFIKYALFTLCLLTLNPVFAMEYTDRMEESEEITESSPFPPVPSLEEQHKIKHALCIATEITYAYEGSLHSQKNLCSLCADPKSTPEQKQDITSCLQELSSESYGIEKRIHALCALAYLHATYHAPKSETVRPLIQTTRYLFQAHALLKANPKCVNSKKELLTIIDLILKKWICELRTKITSPEESKIFELQVLLVDKLRSRLEADVE